MFALTSNKVYLQDTENPNYFKTLIDITNIEDHFICGIFEGFNSLVNPYYNLSVHIYVVVNDSILIEINIHNPEPNLENILINFLVKNKTEGQMKMTKYDIISKNTNSGSSNYTLLAHENSKNLKSVWKFSDKIICLKIRPKSPNKSNDNSYQNSFMTNNHVAISFHGGKLKVFHYESRILVNEYKTNYGNIISMEYSPDGKLLGLGTESDNVYILDAEYGNLLYCLEGHMNYVTSLVFSEVNEEESQDKNLLESKLNDSHDNLAFLSLNTQKHNNLLNKQLSVNEFSSLFDDSDELENTVDIKRLRKLRTSVKNLIDVNEMDNISTYDLYTAGLDGYLAVWRIEYFYDEGFNAKNYFPVPKQKDSIQTIRIDQPVIINLSPYETNIIFHSDMKKIRNSPISQFHFYDNTIVCVSKRNIFEKQYQLNFFSGKVIIEESSETDPSKLNSYKTAENFKKSTSTYISATPSDIKYHPSGESNKISSSVIINNTKIISNHKRISESSSIIEKRPR